MSVPAVSSLPKIVIDGRMVGPVPHGFSRYVANLARGLLELREAQQGLPYEPIFLIGKSTPERTFGGFGTVPVGAPFLSPVELVEIPVVLRKLGARAFHSPTFSSLLPVSVPCPWIVTIHDLNHLSYGGLSKRLYYRHLLRPFARKAAALLTVSEFSRGELAAWLAAPSSGIEVVPNSLDEDYQRPLADEEVLPVLERLGLSRGNYFFCLSNPKPHKNLPLLIQAHARYREKAGEAAWPLVLSLSGPAQPGLRYVGGVNDADARALVTGSGAVVFPSLYEGFGLPPVEAAASGVPVIVSRIPPHEEGLAELKPAEVLWVAPPELDAWVDALARASRGEVAHPSMDSRARTIARFSIERMGRNMDRIYRRVLGLKA